MTRAPRPAGIVLAVTLTAMMLIALPAGPTRAIIPRINVSPSAFTLVEGASTQVSATLDEPIVCPDLSLPCSVILDFSASIPSGVSLSTSSIQWTQAEWLQSKTFSVSMTNPGLLSDNQVFHLVAVADSRSEYYSGFAVDVTVTVAIAQTTTSIRSTTSTVATKQPTGSSPSTAPSTTVATSTSPPGGTGSDSRDDADPTEENGRGPTAAPWVFGALVAGLALTFRGRLRRK